MNAGKFNIWSKTCMKIDWFEKMLDSKKKGKNDSLSAIL